MKDFFSPPTTRIFSPLTDAKKRAPCAKALHGSDFFFTRDKGACGAIHLTV